MTEIEKKALALLNEVQGSTFTSLTRDSSAIEALCRAIEQHEDFKQRVSFALKTFKDGNMHTMHDYLLEPFIIPKPKPDPLVAAVHEVDTGPAWDSPEDYCNKIRAKLDALGFEIREKNGG